MHSRCPVEVLRVGRQELGHPVVVVHKRKQNYYTIHVMCKCIVNEIM